MQVRREIDEVSDKPAPMYSQLGGWKMLDSGRRLPIQEPLRFATVGWVDTMFYHTYPRRAIAIPIFLKHRARKRDQLLRPVGARLILYGRSSMARSRLSSLTVQCRTRVALYLYDCEIRLSYVPIMSNFSTSTQVDESHEWSQGYVHTLRIFLPDGKSGLSH